MPTHDILFAYDFPPMGGGIARMMAQIAAGYPSGELLVSTGRAVGAGLSDAALPGPVDRIAVSVERLRTVQGRLIWSHRAAQLARDPSARFAWCGTFRPAAYPARWAWQRHRLPYGIIFYGGDLLAIESKLVTNKSKRRSYPRLLDSAAVLVAISSWTADRLLGVLGRLGLEHLESRVRVVGLGTDPEHYKPDQAAAAAFQRDRRLPAGRWLVTVARLVPHKGIDTAIDVLAHLAEEFPELRYAVIGRGEGLAALKGHAVTRGVSDRVHFLTDVGDDQLPGAYALGELYLGLSRQAGLDAEGFGLALIEAAACALPVVAGASGGTADAVADGETGFLVRPADVGGAADAVRRLLNNPALAQRMGAAGRRRVTRQFTWPRVVADFRSMAQEFGRQ